MYHYLRLMTRGTGVLWLMLLTPSTLPFAQSPNPCSDPFDVSGGDTDGDGINNQCDCDPDDGSVFWIPAEVANVQVDVAYNFTWDDLAATSGSGLSYDVVRGNVVDLRAGDPSSEVCASEDGMGAAFQDTEPPPPDTIWFYEMRGNHACGAGPFADGRVHSACASPANAPPPPVTGVEGTTAGADVTISWLPIPGAVDYAIYRIGATASERYGDCLVSGLTGTTFTDVGGLAGTPPVGVSYIVVARNANGESSLGSSGLNQQRFRAGSPCP